MDVTKVAEKVKVHLTWQTQIRARVTLGNTPLSLLEQHWLWRNAAWLCREKVRKSKVQVGLNFSRGENNKKKGH